MSVPLQRCEVEDIPARIACSAVLLEDGVIRFSAGIMLVDWVVLLELVECNISCWLPIAQCANNRSI